MTPSARRMWLLLVALVAMDLGCGGPGGVSEKASKPEAGEADEPQQEEAQPADAAVRAVVEGLAENRPEVVWEFLPERYQQDVSQVVHEFAGHMDAELWTRLFGSAQKITEVLKTKKQFILENRQLQGAENVDPQIVAANWDGLVGLLSTLVDSELSDLEKLKSLDIGQYVANTGGSLMTQMAALSKLADNDPFGSQLAKLSKMNVELVRSEGDQATLRLIPVDGEDEPEEHEFVRVEGKWLPQSIVDSWDQSISNARTAMAERLAPEVLEVSKPRLLQTFDFVDQMADALLETETSQEFETVVNEQIVPTVAMLMMMTGGGLGRGMKPDVPAEPLADSVTIIIEADLDENSQDQLIEMLLDKVDDPDLGLAPPPTSKEGQTRIEVSPVGDVAAFAGRLDFVKVTGIDSEQRTISVELEQKEP